MLTRDQVLHIARLARLELSEQELKNMPAELSAILDYIAMLNEVKTDKVEPTAQVTGQSNVLREDEPRKDGQELADKLLGATPLPIVERQIRVPSAHG